MRVSDFFNGLLISLLIVSVSIFLTSCSSVQSLDTTHPLNEGISTASKFTESQQTKLKEALVIADNSITDSLFEKILTAQSAANIYIGRANRIASLERPHGENLVSFFLSELQHRGLPQLTDFVAKDAYKNDRVTGSTVPCSVYVNFNVDNLNQVSRTSVYVAGTIVHERLHSFCYRHRSNDIRKNYNICDLAYQAGHLTTVIALYRANDSKPIKRPMRMCESLVARLKDEKVIQK